MHLILKKSFLLDRKENYVNHKIKSCHSKHSNSSFLNRNLEDFSLVVRVDYRWKSNNLMAYGLRQSNI